MNDDHGFEHDSPFGDLGELLRDEGLERIEASTTTPDYLWECRAFDALGYVDKLGFTSEDIRAYAGSPIHPNRMGAFIMSLARQKLVEPTGRIVKAKRAPRHASMLREWRLL